MTNLDALATVVELALMIEDRDKRETRALIKVAHQVDKERNHNRHPDRDYYFRNPSRLAVEAGCTKADCRVCRGRSPCRCTLDVKCERCQIRESESIPAGERCAS